MKPLRGKLMGPQSRPVEFNSSEARSAGAVDPHGTAARVSRVPEGALSTGRAPRPVRRRSKVSGKGSRAGFGRLCVIVPGFGGPLANRGIACRRFRLLWDGAGPCVGWSGRGRTVHSVLRLPGLSAMGVLPCGSLGSVANRSAPHQTRLETRTKESNMCASHWALRNPQAQ